MESAPNAGRYVERFGRMVENECARVVPIVESDRETASASDKNFLHFVVRMVAAGEISRYFADIEHSADFERKVGRGGDES